MKNMTAKLFFCLIYFLSLNIYGSDHLVGYWPMNEGKGLTLDELSGKSSAVDLKNIIPWGKENGEIFLKFNSTRKDTFKIVSSPAWDSPDKNITIFFQAKIKNGGCIIDHRFDAKPGRWAILATGKRIEFVTYLSPRGKKRRNLYATTRNLDLNAWHSYTLVWQRTGENGWVKMYVDGKILPSFTVKIYTEGKEDKDFSGTVKFPRAESTNLFIASMNAHQQFIGGSIKNLAIFDQALSAKEVNYIQLNGIKLALPIVISKIEVDKIFYSPKEKAKLSIILKNTTKQAQKMRLQVQLISFLDKKTTIAGKGIELNAGERIELSFADINLSEHEYGCEIKAEVIVNNKVLTSKRTFFQVADNIWKVGISGVWGAELFTGSTKGYLNVPEKAKKRYQNWVEFLFASPCDWAKHVSPTKNWWSGQTSYPENADNLCSLVKKLKKQGIKSMIYANRNPCSPFGWEVVRRFPEWFPAVEQYELSPKLIKWFDNWNNPTFRKKNPDPKFWTWQVPPLDLSQKAPLHYGIDRLIEGASEYGYSGVRFDGHYIEPGRDEISTRNAKELKKRVWRKIPEFTFGYNYGRDPSWKGDINRHELRESMAGGGMYLSEAIRSYGSKPTTNYKTWSEYSTNELKIAKHIQSLGGFYHCMWGAGRKAKAEGYYQFVYGLIAGGHPAITNNQNIAGSPSWEMFMTRWSAFFWHESLKKANNEMKNIQVSNEKIQWKPYVQEFIATKTSKYLIIHLVTPPISDKIKKTVNKFPDLDAGTQLTYKTVNGTNIEAVSLIRPNDFPFAKKIKSFDKNELNIKLPQPEFWEMLILKLKGNFKIPIRKPKFTEAVNSAKIVKNSTTKIRKRLLDPNKEDEVMVKNLKKNEKVFPVKGGSGVACGYFFDKNSIHGRVQCVEGKRLKGSNNARLMGNTYMTQLKPGKYKIHYFVKWLAGKNNAPISLFAYCLGYWKKGKQWISPNQLKTNNPKKLKNLSLYSKLGKEGEYAYITLEHEVVKKEYVSPYIMLLPEKQKDSGQKLLLDHIKIEPVSTYSDEKIATSKNFQPPENLRTPNSSNATPKKVLFVRGMYAQLYEPKQLINIDDTYTLPNNYSDLFKYDVVVLVNYNLIFTTWQQRRIIYDFVSNGGRLLVLGGLFSFNSNFTNTYLDDMMPGTVGTLTKLPTPQKILPGNTENKIGDSGTVFWKYKIGKLKDGAVVLAKAGGEPVLLSRSVAKGKVFLFLGTTMGEGKAKQQPFWQHDKWKRFLLNIITKQ